jgi:hypothetical protein
VPIVIKSGSLNLLEPSGPVKACNGIALPLPHFLQVALLLYTTTYRCLLRVLCLVRRPVSTLDCLLLNNSNKAKSVLYKNLESARPRGRPRNRWQNEVREGGWKNSWWRRVAGKGICRRRMEEDPENGKELSRSANGNGMNE